MSKFRACSRCAHFAKRYGSNFLFPRFLCFLISGFLGFSISWLLGFSVSWFLGLLAALGCSWLLLGSWFLDFLLSEFLFFPTCQVRVVRFYVSCRASSSPPPSPPPSPRRRTSTTTIHAQCSLPDLNHDQPRPVFAARPQPRPSTPSVRCRTSTTTVNAQCSLPDLNSYAKSYAR